MKRSIIMLIALCVVVVAPASRLDAAVNVNYKPLRKVAACAGVAVFSVAALGSVAASGLACVGVVKDGYAKLAAQDDRYEVLNDWSDVFFAHLIIGGGILLGKFYMNLASRCADELGRINNEEKEGAVPASDAVTVLENHDGDQQKKDDLESTVTQPQ